MKSKKILIVDDNDLNRKLFENLIGQLYAYESAKNGIEALEKVQNDFFDLVLMDIQMPQMDGITAMKKLKITPGFNSPVVAVTAFAEENERNNFLEQGFDDFIIKPIRPREFLMAIQDLLNNASKKLTEDLSEQREEVLDKKLLEQLFKYNSKQAIQKVFEDFIAECQYTESIIDLPSTDCEALLENIHCLKGNSGTLGAQKIYLIAQKAENTLRRKDMEEWQKLKNILKNEFREFQEFLNQETIFES